MKKGKWVDDEKVADIAVDNLKDDGPGWSCPITGDMCRVTCLCYLDPEKAYNSNKMKWEIRQGSCTNAMFFPKGK